MAGSRVFGGRRHNQGLLHLRGDSRGQSAAVGTILAIMVILTLLTVVTTKWIPVWVAGREAEHAGVVEAQFQELKKTIDQQALIGTPGLPVGNPITLGHPGVPVFAPGSAGTINNGAYGTTLARNQLNIQNATQILNRTAFGAIKYTSANTRYLQQSHLYEFGGIIVNQTDGQILLAGPGFQFDNSSNSTQIRLTLISIAGDGSAYSGDSTVSVRTALLFAPVVTENNFTTPETIWLNLTSESGPSWASHLNKSISARLPASQFNITYNPSTLTVSVRFTAVTKIIISYQVFNSELDLS